MIRALIQVLRDDGGATMVEYAIVAAAIAIPVLAAFVLIETTTANVYTSTGANLRTAGETWQ